MAQLKTVSTYAYIAKAPQCMTTDTWFAKIAAESTRISQETIFMNQLPNNSNKGGAPMHDNVIPFKKYERYQLSLAAVTHDCEVIERDQVGFAFLKPGAKAFRLKLWALPNVTYFLVQDESKSLEYYQVLAIEKYQAANGEVKTNWNKVGTGILVGNFIMIKIQFFD